MILPSITTITTAVSFVYQIGDYNFMIYVTFREKNEGDISASILKVKFLSAKFVNNRKDLC